MAEETITEENNQEGKSKKLELIIALTITFFAAISAINGLYGGKYGDDEMIAHNKENQMSVWYQAKSTKQILAENQRDMLKGLITSKVVADQHRAAVDSLVFGLDEEIKRYKKEKKEILLGSKAVGKENWAQDVDGELGKVIGVKDYEKTAEELGTAGDDFDTGSLLLNLCLVFGAVAIILQEERTRLIFFWMLVGFGTAGSIFTIIAYVKAIAIV